MEAVYQGLGGEGVLYFFYRKIWNPSNNPKRIFTDYWRGDKMSALSLRLPKTLHEQLKELALEEGISVNQFVMLAVAEKVTSISTIEYLEKRAKRGSREKFLEILNKVPDVEPEEFDKL